ncbi:MAG: hypothetical protein RPT25_09825 [Cycloclasticus sp.]|jgi:hypothetical protein
MLHLTQSSKQKSELQKAKKSTNSHGIEYINARYDNNEQYSSLQKLKGILAQLKRALKLALSLDKKHVKRWPFRKAYEEDVRMYKSHAADIAEKITKVQAAIHQSQHVTYAIGKAKDKSKVRLSQHLEKTRAVSVSICEQYFDSRVPKGGPSLPQGDELLKQAFFWSLLGGSLSGVVNMLQIGGVYDALREVNSNFANMSDTEIWFEALAMSDASLQGLQNLTKGRYFENLVAENTGGELFETFNHPGTDMMLGGVEVQLKATDSVAYINSIDDDISVIATSEVAQATGVGDSGILNSDLTEDVTMALGGAPVDVPDLIELLAGALGVITIVKGMADYQERKDAGLSSLDATEEAIIHGAKGLGLSFRWLGYELA